MSGRLLVKQPPLARALTSPSTEPRRHQLHQFAGQTFRTATCCLRSDGQKYRFRYEAHLKRLLKPNREIPSPRKLYQPCAANFFFGMCYDVKSRINRERFWQTALVKARLSRPPRKWVGICNRRRSRRCRPLPAACVSPSPRASQFLHPHQKYRSAAPSPSALPPV